MNDEEFFAPYEIPHPDSDPAKIAAVLLELPEFEHLRDGEARIRFLMRVMPKIKAGREILGTCYLPTVQGELKDMFDWLLHDLLGETPDFLIVIDAGYWEQASALEREILVFHEMLHCGQKQDQYGCPKFTLEGDPCWMIRGHDVEEFIEVVSRYGAHNDEIRRFIEAAGDGKRPVPGTADASVGNEDVF